MDTTLYHALAPTGDFVFAPTSIAHTFGLVVHGARGNTARQLAALFPSKNPPPSSPLVRVANAAWLEQTFTLRPDYRKSVAAFLHHVDFFNAPEAARQRINDWVADQTDQRIQALLPPGSVLPLTRLVLTNAVYFKGEWATPLVNVGLQDFTTLNGHVIQRPMMGHRLKIAYGRGRGFQAVEVPYQHTDWVMLLILPDDFAHFESRFDLSKVAKSLRRNTGVDLTLPLFEFSFQASLKNALQSVGVVDAFDEQLADFSAMAAVTAETNLYISEAFHKAFIKVDEQGTEAAAATGAVMAQRKGGFHVERIIPLRFDRPFLFAIRDQQSILFLGRVVGN